MLKTKYKGHTIEIQLPKEEKYKGYSIECTYKYVKKQDKYLLSMWLKRNDIEDKLKIESQNVDTQLISGTRETIVDNICRIVEQASMHKYFDYYIERFNYFYECFDLGNDVIEKEDATKDIND